MVRLHQVKHLIQTEGYADCEVHEKPILIIIVVSK